MPPGVMGTEMNKICVSRSVLQILDIFEHPSDPLREALQLHQEQFSPDDPYWKVRVHSYQYLTPIYGSWFICMLYCLSNCYLL